MKQEVKEVQVGSVRIGGTSQSVLIAGPCVIESHDHALKMAEIILEIASEYGFSYIFKASFDKANRSSIKSYRGPGLKKGIETFRAIKSSLNIPILTDIHEKDQISMVAEAVDMIQIPAFLCRQTDLYIEAGKHALPVNIKKGQFMAPWDMKNVVEKAHESGVQQLTLTERGVSFGYNRLVVDFTSLPIMRSLKVPVVFDATHSLQLPAGGGAYSDGMAEYVPYLCRAGVAVGCDAIFLEVHDQPERALSDGKNMITPETLRVVLQEMKLILESLSEG